MLVSDLSVICNFTQYSTHAIQCSAILRNVTFFVMLRNYTCSFVFIEHSNSKDETFK